ncbi:MAG: glycosyltransferase family 4 protein [Chloroflexi bacterium]|nr:glycosyltransferase family 4 protein [Chloroflexota bacterium]
MRVLLITDTLAPTYGWGRYAIGLIRALQRQGLPFRLLSPVELCVADDLRLLPEHGSVTSFVTETRRITRLVAANALRIRRALAGCDVVHCLTEPYAIPAALVAGRKPLFVTLHGTYAVRPFTRWRERPWYELAYRRADRLLPVSEFTRSLLPAPFRGPKTQVIPEGVDVERFSAAGERASGREGKAGGAGIGGPCAAGDVPVEAHPEAPDRPYLLSVGPIKRRKGYHVSLEAFARVRAARPDVEYWIAGGTDDRAFLRQLQQRIAELGLEHSVKLLGRVSDDELVRLYRQCAAFWLLPVSDDLQFEGFGLVYWEANACGRPIVGSRGSGAEDAVADGENGFLVPNGDASAAAAAALRLLGDPALAALMGDAGRRRVRPWDDAAGLLMAQYRQVVGIAPSPPGPLSHKGRGGVPCSTGRGGAPPSFPSPIVGEGPGVRGRR